LANKFFKTVLVVIVGNVLFVSKALFLEANTSSTIHEIPRILWKIKCLYHVHNSMPFFPILSQINAYHILPSTSLIHNLIISSHLPLSLPSSLHPSVFYTKTVQTLPSGPLLATCSAYRILLISCTNIIVLGPPW
jgi:hypothetical protein